MNTARIAKISIPYNPEPTPPKTTSPSCISQRGHKPPSGMKESCIALTDPLDAAVVAVAQSAEPTGPLRASFPSMFPPGCVADGAWSAPMVARAGLPACSAAIVGIVSAA